MVKHVIKCSWPSKTHLAFRLSGASGSAELTLCTTLRTKGWRGPRASGSPALCPALRCACCATMMSDLIRLPVSLGNHARPFTLATSQAAVAAYGCCVMPKMSDCIDLPLFLPSPALCTASRCQMPDAPALSVSAMLARWCMHKL